ncbi:MAG: ParB/RepB/Spo0J family partition protein [Pseudomonadota bacterium]
MSSKKSERRGLGRGLSALMGDVTAEVAAPVGQSTGDGQLQVPIEDVSPNPDQPRRHFDEEALKELAQSISEKGIIQPLIVRTAPEGTGARYQIVAGERRWRAAQLARQHEIPVLLRDISDSEVMELAIIENIQRADLNPIEEAEGYRALMERHSRTQDEMAQALGKSRSHVANTLRLVQLPESVQRLVRAGDLSAGHARALITADDPEGLARVVVAKGLSVRDTERLAKSGLSDAPRPPVVTASEKDADTRALEGDLSANLGMRVTIETDKDGSTGRLTVRFKSLDDLDELCRMLSASPNAGRV